MAHQETFLVFHPHRLPCSQPTLPSSDNTFRQKPFWNRSVLTLICLTTVLHLPAVPSALGLCIPLDPVDGDTVTCSGPSVWDPSTHGQVSDLTINVENGATVTGSTGIATGGNTTLTNEGRIEGVDNEGVRIGAGGGEVVTITNRTGGQIFGGQSSRFGIDLGLGNLGGMPATLTLTNEAGATMDGIRAVGNFGGTLTNAGTNMGEIFINNFTNGGTPGTPIIINQATGMIADGVAVAGTNSVEIINAGGIAGGSSGLFDGVFFTNGQLTNQAGGTIIGLRGVAIEGTGTVINEAGSTITGGFFAIDGGFVGDTTVTNAGTLNGGVELGTGTNMFRHTGTLNGDVFGSSDGDDTVINGGTINGGVFLGFGDDTFLVDLDGSTPPVVTGIIEGGEGTDKFGVSTSLVKSATLTVAGGFEQLAAEANGADAELTLNPGAGAFGQTLTISGGGTIINNADFDVTGGPAIQFEPGTSETTLRQNATLTTRGVLDVGIVMNNGNSLEHNGNMVTEGDMAEGIRGGDSNTITILENGTVRTEGLGAAGIRVDNGNSLLHTGHIETMGQDADGIVGLNKNGLEFVQELGGEIVTRGMNASGIHMMGNLNVIRFDVGGETDTMVETLVTTMGAAAVGVKVEGNENEVNIQGNNLLFDVNDQAISTGGADAHGISISGKGNLISIDQAGGAVVSTNALISTAGRDAYGLNVQGEDNRIELSGERLLTTSGDLAHAINIHGSNNEVKLQGADGKGAEPAIETTGLNAAGLVFQDTGNSVFLGGNEGIVINAQQGPAIAVDLAGAPDDRSNRLDIAGHIRGGNGIAIQGDPIHQSIEEVVQERGEAVAPNSGLIEGNVELFAGDDSFTMDAGNLGVRVEGDVLMGMGNDAVKLFDSFGLSGSFIEISGSLEGGAGVDSLDISNLTPENVSANRLSVTLGGLSGFETRTVSVKGATPTDRETEVVLNGNGQALTQGFSLTGDGGRIINNAAFMVTDDSVFILDGVGVELVNNATIQSNGVGTAAVQFSSTGGSGNVISNHGMIIGGDGLAIAADGSTADFLTNFSDGTIFGLVDLAGGPDTVTNAGLINGNVRLGVLEDNFIVTTTGIMTGFADGGLDVDGLAFTTVGTDKAILGDRYVNFEILDKRGSEKLQLGGTLSVDTGTVSEGEFVLLPESVLDLDELTVKSGATLGGTGTVSGTVTGEASSTIGPGFSPGGPLTILGDLDITDGGKLLLEIASLPSFDSIAFGGDLLLSGGGITFDLLGDLEFPPFADEFSTPADFFFALSNPTDPTSALLPLTDLSVFEGVDFFVQGGGFTLEPLIFNDASFSFRQSNLGMDGGEPNPVPVPSTLLLFGSGILVMIWYVWRRERM